MAEADHVLHGDSAIRVQRGAYHADGRLNAMLAGLDATQMRESGDHTDGAVSAHAKIADVIEENDAGDAVRIGGLKEQRAYQDVGSAGFVDDGRAKMIVL